MPIRVLAPLISHQEVAPAHFRMRLAVPKIASIAEPGQFLHVLSRTMDCYDPLLRRAFSILKADNETLEILYRAEGRGTAALARAATGSQIDVLGPLGHPFQLQEGTALLVGGGVGVPPLAMLASRLSQRTQPIRAFIGARSQREVICTEDFEEYDVPVEIATDDGSAGHQGRITELLDSYLKSQDANANTCVYSCGPLPMLRAIAHLCQQYSIPAQISLEESMPCGIGVCNGCVVPVTNAENDYERFRRICVQGPVLWADEVDWSHYDSACL